MRFVYAEISFFEFHMGMYGFLFDVFSVGFEASWAGLGRSWGVVGGCSWDVFELLGVLPVAIGVLFVVLGCSQCFMLSAGRL